MSATAWIPIVTEAIAFAVRIAKQQGAGPLDPEDVERVLNTARDALAAAIPTELHALNVAVQSVAAKALADIATIAPKRCPNCHNVVTIRAEKTISTGEVTQMLSCDSCGWPEK